MINTANYHDLNQGKQQDIMLLGYISGLVNDWQFKPSFSSAGTLTTWYVLGLLGRIIFALYYVYLMVDGTDDALSQKIGSGLLLFLNHPEKVI